MDLDPGPGLSTKKLALVFACLFVVLAVLLPTAGFFDLYLLPWQSRVIIVDDPNLWHAMRDNPAAYLPFTTFSALPYGPLFYYPLSLWLFVLDELFLIDLDAWADFSVAPESMRYTALLKVPNLLVYFAVGFTLLHTLPGRAGQDAMLLWLVNPAVILASFVMGQNDSWSLLSILLALLLASQALQGRQELQLGRWRVPSAPLAMVVLGAGGAVKLHPLLFVTPFALALGQTWRERALLAGVGLATFGLLIAPFVGDSFFREHALNNPQSRDLLDRRIGAVPVFYLTYGLAVLPALFRRGSGLQGLFATIVAVHLLVFALTDWPPERAVWFIGALVLPATVSRVALAAYLLTTIQALLIAVKWGNSLGAGAFGLLSAEFNAWPGLSEALDRVWDFDHFHTVGLGFAIAAWCLTFAVLAVSPGLRARAVSPVLPVAVLSLLGALFAGAIAYGAGGWTTALAGATSDPVVGPVTVEQEFLAGSFSAVDVAFHSGSAQQPLIATLESVNGPAPSSGVTTANSGDGHARLRFDKPFMAAGLYRLRLEIPAGAKVGTVVGASADARVDGHPAGWTVDFRLHRDRDWSALRRDMRRRLEDEPGVPIAMGALLAAALGLVWWQAARR